MKHEYAIEGMHCDGCVRRVKALLGKVEGATVAEVSIGKAVVDLGDDARAPALLEVLVKAGYQAREVA